MAMESQRNRIPRAGARLSRGYRGPFGFERCSLTTGKEKAPKRRRMVSSTAASTSPGRRPLSNVFSAPVENGLARPDGGRSFNIPTTVADSLPGQGGRHLTATQGTSSKCVTRLDVKNEATIARSEHHALNCTAADGNRAIRRPFTSNRGTVTDSSYLRAGRDAPGSFVLLLPLQDHVGVFGRSPRRGCFEVTA